MINGRQLVEPPVSDNPEENCPDWYKAVTKCEKVRLPGQRTQDTAIYACWKFIAGNYYGLNLDSVKDADFKVEPLDYAIEKFHKLIPVEIMKMWEFHMKSHKELNILRSILQLCIMIEVTNAITENVIKDFGLRRGNPKEDTFYISLINKLTREVKSGNVYEITSTVFEAALNYMVNELGKNPSTAFQSFMLNNLIKLGSVTSAIDSLRPEHALNPLARTLWQTALANVMTEKIAMASKSLMEYFSGSTVKSLYGQELVAMLKYEKATDAEIMQITGFTSVEINQYWQQWNARVEEKKIDERNQQEIFVSVIDKICQVANFKFLDKLKFQTNAWGSMALNSLCLAGTNVCRS